MSIFAAGNISDTWASFEALHKCSAWCKHYQLPTNYKEWEVGVVNSEIWPHSMVRGMDDVAATAGEGPIPEQTLGMTRDMSIGHTI